MVVGTAAREADQLVQMTVGARQSRRMSATNSISETPGGISSARSRRTDSGICSKSSETEDRPIDASMSRISSSVCGANLT